MPLIYDRTQLKLSQQDLVEAGWAFQLENDKLTRMGHLKGTSARTDVAPEAISEEAIQYYSGKAIQGSININKAYPGLFHEREALVLSCVYHTMHFKFLTEELEAWQKRLAGKTPKEVQQTILEEINEINDRTGDRVEKSFGKLAEENDVPADKVMAVISVLGPARIRSDRSAEEKAILDQVLANKLLEKKRATQFDGVEQKFNENYAAIVAEVEQEVTSNGMLQEVRQRVLQDMDVLRSTMQDYSQNAIEVSAFAFARTVLEYNHDMMTGHSKLIEETPTNEDDLVVERKWTQIQNEITVAKERAFVDRCMQEGLKANRSREAWDVMLKARKSGMPMLHVIEPFGMS